MNTISTVTGAAVGMAVGAAVMYAATQDERQVRRTVHKMAKSAEKAIIGLDRMVSHNFR